MKHTGEAVAAGCGEPDYDRYLENLRGVGFEGPLILHSLEEAEEQGSVAFLLGKLRKTLPISNAGEEEPAAKAVWTLLKHTTKNEPESYSSTSSPQLQRAS